MDPNAIAEGIFDEVAEDLDIARASDEDSGINRIGPAAILDDIIGDDAIVKAASDESAGVGDGIHAIADDANILMKATGANGSLGDIAEGVIADGHIARGAHEIDNRIGAKVISEGHIFDGDIIGIDGNGEIAGEGITAPADANCAGHAIDEDISAGAIVIKGDDIIAYACGAGAGGGIGFGGEDGISEGAGTINCDGSGEAEADLKGEIGGQQECCQHS